MRRGAKLEVDSPQEAGRYYSELCDERDIAEACNESGRFLGADDSEKVRMFTRACELDLDVGCANLAYHYVKGEGVAKDVERAEELYARACEGTDKGACAELAALYLSEGRDIDGSVLAELLAQACEADWKDRCYTLGYWYLEGIQVAKNYERAEKWLERGCDLGHPAACVYLGVILTHGYTGRFDHKRANKYFQSGCDADDLDGCLNLYDSQTEGRGMAKDEQAASKTLLHACELAASRDKDIPDCPSSERPHKR